MFNETAGSAILSYHHQISPASGSDDDINKALIIPILNFQSGEDGNTYTVKTTATDTSFDSANEEVKFSMVLTENDKNVYTFSYTPPAEQAEP